MKEDNDIIQVRFEPTSEELDCLIFVEEYGLAEINEQQLALLEGIKKRLEKEHPGVNFPLEGLEPQH